MKYVLPLAAGLCLLLAVAWSAQRPPAVAAEAPPADETLVPYRLTDTRHIMVRARINGKGPYNFVLDTGSPALFVSTALAASSASKPSARAGPRSSASSWKAAWSSTRRKPDWTIRISSKA